MKNSNPCRDVAYGACVLRLRTMLALSQAGLARLLGVSRQAVGAWETGKSVPKAEHLKALIALAVKSQAFAARHQAEEIRRLWKATLQKKLLDKGWLSTLLAQPPSPFLSLGLEPVEESRNRAPVQASPATLPRVDWGEALVLPAFYGREEELARLSQWVVQGRCRVVSVLGMGGIGKSALVVKLMSQLALQFEVVIFRSLRDAPSLEALLDDCLQVLASEPLGTRPSTLEQRLSHLASHLRETRTLLVLDNLEALLQEGDLRGRLRPGFEEYGQLLQLVAERGHQSCLLLTSREKPTILRLLEGRSYPMRSLSLAGLDAAACSLLLEENELVGTEREQERLVEAYSGNPMALKIVAATIRDLFGGEIGPFLRVSTVVFGSITELLDEHFARLSALEKTLLYWLAIVREPVALQELLALLVTKEPRVQMLEAIESLSRRSLIERGKRPGNFTLQPVVLEYVTADLIAKAASETKLRRLDRLIQHGFSLAHSREYIRQTQERLLLSPLLRDLQRVSWGQTDLEEHLRLLLKGLRERTDDAQGYGPANLLALLRLLRGNLNDLDLSHLCIRGAYLQGVEMHDTSLAGSLIRDSVLTEAVSAIWSVASSPDGSLWAASGIRGEVRVWEEEGRTLRLSFQAHTDIAQALAFSPNGHWLSSGGMDGSVKLWNLEIGRNFARPSDALLWVGWHNNPQMLAFSPDSCLLASCGLSPTVLFWETKTGTILQRLEHPAQVWAIAWSPDGRLFASSCFDGQLRLWERCQDRLRSLRSSWEAPVALSLAFSPDGRILASSGWRDRKIRLWEAASGLLLHTFEGETDQKNRVAFSPDGRLLAGCSYERAIRLFDVEQRRVCAMLSGHTSEIYGIAFTPDGLRLLSGSDDGTLRVWDIESKQCVRVMAGYAVSLWTLDWSPDGRHLVSGDTDGLVTLWEPGSGLPPKILHGHSWIVSAVGWSPDGELVASGGWDMVLRLWDPTSGACRQTLSDLSAVCMSTAWSPDGSLLAVGTFDQGMSVWDVGEKHLHWVGGADRAVFFSVAWSPDGSFLAGGGDDGNVYLWSTDGTQRVPLRGHHGNVTSLAFSPDGKWLASSSVNRGEGELFVWEVQSGTCIRSFAGHPDAVHAVAWSRSQAEARDAGYRLISGGGDGMLRWWDVLTTECISTQTAHQGTIRSLKVSPDGKRLASCGDDGAIGIWDLSRLSLLQTLRRDRPYERMNITGIRGLKETEIASLQALGAIEEIAAEVGEGNFS